VPPSDLSQVDLAIDALHRAEVSGITFSSANGVQGFFQRLQQRQFDARLLAGTTIAAVGPATAAQLVPWGLRADVIPAGSQAFSAVGLLDALPASLSGERWIVTTTNRSRDTLSAGLQQRGADVLQALSYETRRVTQLSPHVASALDAGRIDVVTISSSLVAEASYDLLAPYRAQLRPVSISAAVSQRLSELNWPAVAEAQEHSIDGMRAAIESCCK
jgi:uroporphyrinogen III methyltransferase/synthase